MRKTGFEAVPKHEMIGNSLYRSDDLLDNPLLHLLRSLYSLCLFHLSSNLFYLSCTLETNLLNLNRQREPMKGYFFKFEHRVPITTRSRRHKKTLLNHVIYHQMSGP